MDSYHISLQIADAQSRLSAARSKLSSLRKDRDDLDELSQKHESTRSSVTSDIESRVRRLDSATIDEKKVRSFASYKTVMREKLAGGGRITSALDDTTIRINRAIDDIDWEITIASRNCDCIEDEISSLRTSYNNAKLLEAAS